jgi:hypothetical protein
LVHSVDLSFINLSLIELRSELKELSRGLISVH